MAGRGRAGRDRSMLGVTARGWSWLVPAWLGTVRPGKAGHGGAGLGMAWQGGVRRGKARFLQRRHKTIPAWLGVAGRGRLLQVAAWHVQSRLGQARQGF